MRRCHWCGVELRWWQINQCRVCHAYIQLDHPSSPCGQGTRWDMEPDHFLISFDVPGPTHEWRTRKKAGVYGDR